MGVRRLWALVSGLSPRSAYARAAVFEGREWGTLEDLLAIMVEQLDHLNRQMYASGRKASDPKPWKPLQIDRPGQKKERPKPLRGAELAAAFKRFGGPVESTFIEYHPPKEGGEN